MAVGSIAVDVVVEEHTGVVDGELAAAWEDLLAVTRGAVFQGPRYLQTWFGVLGGGDRARTLLVRGADSNLIGVVAEGWDAQGTGRFLGGVEVTDYLGPVARPEHRDAVVAAHLAHLAADDDVTTFTAGGLGEDLGWPDAYRAAAADHGFELADDVTEGVCPRVDVSGGDAYQERLDGRERKEQKRKIRKLAREVGELAMVTATTDDVAERLDAFFEMVGENDQAKAEFFANDDHRRFFCALADEFTADGTFRLDVLEVDGLPAAATVSLLWPGEWALYNSAFDPALGDYAPGVVQIAMLLQESADMGYDVFDLLRGGEAYKYRFGAEDRKIARLTLTRR